MGIAEPSRFGPGKTDEPFPLEDEIEFYVDTNGGADHLRAGNSVTSGDRYLTARRWA